MKRNKTRVRQEIAAITTLVDQTIKRIYTGEPIYMLVSVVDMRGNNITIQTVNGHPNPPPPPPIQLLVNPPMGGSAPLATRSF